jgi:hypothetical protein
VSDTRAKESLEPITKYGPGVRTAGIIWRGGGRSGRVSKDPCPLLDGFIVVLDVQDLIYGAVVDLYLWSWPVVSWVCALHHVRPLLLRVDRPALRASRVPFGRAVRGATETTCRYARVCDSSAEHIGICCSHDVSHHGTGRSSRHVDLAFISSILLSDKGYHVGNRSAGAATVSSESRLGRNVPAVAVQIRRGRIDDNVPIRLGVACPLRALVISLSIASAPVKTDDDGWVRCKISRYVEPHARVCWVCAKGGHL